LPPPPLCRCGQNGAYGSRGRNGRRHRARQGSGAHPSHLACDEITGLITATALVRPSKRIADVEVEKAVAAFSASCFAGSLDPWTHAGHALAAMQGIAGDLGLAGS